MQEIIKWCNENGEFGHHYALNKNGAMPADDKEEVFAQPKE